ncbi:MAG: type IV pilus assembly protein PilM [Eubacteriales bacterium]
MGVKQHKIVAVDVGQHSLNMVLGNGQGMIVKAATVKLPDGVITSSRLNSPDMLTAALREARAKSKITDKNCALVVGGREVIIRYFTLPKMSQEQLYENLISELSSYLPFSAEQYTIDYAIKDVITSEKSVEYRVMVVAIHNEVIMPYVEAFKEAGFRLVRVDIRDNCYEKLMKALEYKNYRVKENFSIIDIGSSSTTVSAYSNKMFFINNTSNIGGNYFRDAVADLYGINPLQAEEKKLEISKIEYSRQDKAVMDIMNAFFEKLVSDAARVFEFFKSNNEQRNVEEIYICGGSSAIKGMPAYIESSSDILTTELRDVIKVLFSPRIINELKLELYGSAVGATFLEVD